MAPSFQGAILVHTLTRPSRWRLPFSRHTPLRMVDLLVKWLLPLRGLTSLLMVDLLFRWLLPFRGRTPPPMVDLLLQWFLPFRGRTALPTLTGPFRRRAILSKTPLPYLSPLRRCHLCFPSLRHQESSLDFILKPHWHCLLLVLLSTRPLLNIQWRPTLPRPILLQLMFNRT